ncbi:IclR family transcriptional regulator [Thalassobacillus sp. CUG 92003]|uniref:IclR family transcriptional regulator n=1 Tax=Thalassobacillus sp. CUG 92003 TaxID=2736641 RepID=UPI0015E71E1E|nr:IclR family transcriptional regulator [Thalassobacillus sp. CUG 92003]
MAGDANRTLERGLDILFQFTEDNPVLTVKEITQQIGLPRSTVYRLLETLKAKSLIQEYGSGQYKLGLSILQLAKVSMSSMDFLNLATPIMKELSRETGETVILSGIVGKQTICFDRVESSKTIKLTFERGKVQSLHAGASAKILLSYMEEEIQENILDDFLESGLIDSKQTFKEQLKHVKKSGYVTSFEEIDQEAWAVAAPIFGSRGHILAGLTVAGPQFRLDEAKKQAILEDLLSYARDLNERVEISEINDV